MNENTTGDTPVIKEVEPIQIEELNKVPTEGDAAPASEEGDKTPQTSQPNYKEKLKQVEKQLGQAEYNIQKEKEKNKDAGSMDADSVKDAIREVLGEQKAEDNKVRIANSLATITNPDERKLVEILLATTIKPSGNPILDIQNARALANATQTHQENEELKRAAMTEGSTDSVGSNVDKGDTEPTDDLSKQFTKVQLDRFAFSGIDPKKVLEKAKQHSSTQSSYGQTTLEDWEEAQKK